MSELLDSIAAAVVEAADIMLARPELNVVEKSANVNFVTAVDTGIQAFLQERLAEILPEASFVGEESEADAVMQGYCFVVDPLDGTSNYIRDLKASAVSVGLLQDGMPCIGVIYAPYTQELYTAERGCGAYLNGERIQVSDHSLNRSLTCLAWSVYDKSIADPCFRISERIYEECEDIRRFGSAAIELAALAAGKIELFFEARLFPWDYAAALIMIEEAGGYSCGLEGRPVDMSRPDTVIAANSRESLDYLRDIAAEELQGYDIPRW